MNKLGKRSTHLGQDQVILGAPRLIYELPLTSLVAVSYLNRGKETLIHSLIVA